MSKIEGKCTIVIKQTDGTSTSLELDGVKDVAVLKDSEPRRVPHWSERSSIWTETAREIVREDTELLRKDCEDDLKRYPQTP